jgi:DNA/RNA endonuclease YhcR with UshA esterase domain
MKPLLTTCLVLFTFTAARAQTTIKLEDVGLHIGDSVTVCGKVAGMRYFENSKDKPTFLNIGAAFPNQSLTVVIWELVRAKFAGKPEDLLNKTVCITGRIILYKEKPEIVIERPEDIVIQ